MSWRTQGHYRGLGSEDREWLRGFDRTWDTQASGRDQLDAHEHLGKAADPTSAICPRVDLYTPQISDIAAPEHEDCEDTELRLNELADHVQRFTVPLLQRTTWGIRLTLFDGRHLRVSFPDFTSAAAAHVLLQSLCSSVSNA